MKNDPPLKLLGFSGKEKEANKFCGKTWVSETSGLSGVDSWTRVKRDSPQEARGREPGAGPGQPTARH